MEIEKVTIKIKYHENNTIVKSVIGFKRHKRPDPPGPADGYAVQH